jgi:rhomboid protease GluP
MFLHSGFVHLLMNMWILLRIGPFTERLFGRVSFLVLYLFAGIGGDLASLAWHPASVAVGASGAIFGLYGGLFAFLLRHSNAVPPQRVGPLVKSGAIFVVANLMSGLATINVDVSAHVGGFVAGLLLGCGLSFPLTADREVRLRRSLVVAVAGLAVAAGWAWRMPVLEDLRPHLEVLRTLEPKTQNLFNQSISALAAHKISAADFSATIDKQLLPPWKTERDTLSKARFAPQQQKIADFLVEYMSLRAEGWSLTKQGMESHNVALMTAGLQKQMAAMAVLRKMNPAGSQSRGGQPARGR